MSSAKIRPVLRRRLERLADRLRSEAESLRQHELDTTETEAVGELSSYDQHSADLGSETFERSKDLGLLERARITLDEVQDALARLDQNRYGYCEACGRFIGLGRLLAIPYARRCIECQSSHDRGEEERVEDHDAGRRPPEEAALLPPWGRSGDPDTGISREGTWEALARYGDANSPQDIPGSVDYDETWAGADVDDPGGVEEVEYIPDVTGRGVVDPTVVYPDPSGPGRRRSRVEGEDEEEPDLP